MKVAIPSPCPSSSGGGDRKIVIAWIVKDRRLWVISDPSKLSVISKGHQASPYGDLRRSQWKDDLDESQHVGRWDNDELIDEIDKTTDEKEEQCKIVIIPDGTSPIRSLTMVIERNREYIDYIHFRGAQMYGFSSPSRKTLFCSY